MGWRPGSDDLTDHDRDRMSLDDSEPWPGCGCRPTAYSGGGYSAMVHAPTCPRSPEKALDAAEMEAWRASLRDPVKESVKAHPSSWADSPGGRSSLMVWKDHPPGHDCPDCLYVEANLDRDTG